MTKGAIGPQLKIVTCTSTVQHSTTLVQFLLAAVVQPEKLYLVFLQLGNRSGERSRLWLVPQGVSPVEGAYLSYRYYSLVRLLIRVHARRSAFACTSRSGMPCRTRVRPPRFRAKNFPTCTRSPTARGSSHASQYAMDDVAFSSTERDRHLGIRPVSQLNTRPVISPVNASRLPSRAEPRASLGVGAVG